jgi:hypothetical protein
MGNRGCLHDDRGNIKRLYQTRRWIMCQLEFKGRHRSGMTPGRYTELFFLDEATALAAGHRPCAECLRHRYNEFVSIWTLANPNLTTGSKMSASDLDAVLHAERLSAKKQKITFDELLSALPNGTFVLLNDPEQPHLVVDDGLVPWRPDGYGPQIPQPTRQTVQVLTPHSIVRTLAAGYRLSK